jgi:hypothetical protein
MRMTGGPSSPLGLPRLSSKSSMLMCYLTLIFREDDGGIDPWCWERSSCGYEARHLVGKAGEAVQAGNINGIDIDIPVLAVVQSGFHGRQRSFNVSTFNNGHVLR